MTDSSMDVWNREQLYGEVWSEPLTKVAKRYGISDVGIAKICRKLNIPLPGRGYWAKKAHGKEVTKAPLPPMTGLPRLPRYVGPRYEPPSVPPFPTHEADVSDIGRIDELFSSGALEFSDKQLRHPLIRESRRLLKQATTDDRGIIRPPWEAPCMNIRVSKPQLDRALRIAAAVVASLEAAGAAVQVRTVDRQQRTELSAFGEHLAFSIIEKARQRRLSAEDLEKLRKRDPYSRRDFVYEPTGKLLVELDAHSLHFKTSWSDAQANPLEQQVPAIASLMLKAAVERRRVAENHRQQELARQRRQEELLALKQQIDEEKQRVQELIGEANDWHQAERIRQYIAALQRTQAAVGTEIDPNSDVGKWIDWALQQADRMDPLCPAPPSILDREEELRELAPQFSYPWSHG